MLQNIRDNAQGVAAKIVIGLIVISFAFFGLQSLVGSGGANNAAIINGEELSVVELNQAVTIQRNRLLNSMGEDADPSQLDMNKLKAPALNQLIQQRLLLQAAAKASINVSESAVDQTIVNMDQFQENGKFSPQLYQNILRSNGYSLAFFKKLVTDDLHINQLSSGVANSNFVTQAELEAMARIIGQKRSFRHFILPAEKVAAQVNITEQDVEQYYRDNLDSFQTEDQVKLSYIEVKQQDFFKPVDDQALEQAYQLEMADFKIVEERRASHILIEVNDERNKQQAEALIGQIADRIAKGESFSELAATLSEDLGSAQSAGDLGFSTGDTFPPEFERALFSLKQGQVSDPVQTDAGFHLISATEIKTGDKPSLEERRPILLQRLQAAAAETDFIRTVEELRDRVFNAEDLAGPAGELGLQTVNTDWIGKSDALGVFSRPEVLAAAYSSDVLVDGNNSEVIELAADHFIVLRVQGHNPAQAKELDDVRAEITASLRRAEITQLALSQAESAISELAEGASIETLAGDNGYEWQISTDVSRNAMTENPEILAPVFAMGAVREGDVRRKAVALMNGDVAVVQLEKVTEGNWLDFSRQEQDVIKAELNRNNGNTAMSNYMESLRSSADIKIL